MSSTSDYMFLEVLYALFFSTWYLSTFSCLMLVFLWKELTMGMVRSRKRLDGKTVVVTGANAGVGFETVRDLSRRGARVILACRDQRRANAAIRAIQTQNKDADLKFMALDLSSLKSVHSFAEQFKRNERKLDILVNNAGVGSGAAIVPDAAKAKVRRLTEDKLEFVMQTNHFAHFLLTNLLHDVLKSSDDPRVVNLASMAHLDGKMDVENINYDITYDRPNKVYNDTKLANCVFTRESARRWSKDGISSFAVHPGLVRSSFFDKMSDVRKKVIMAIAFVMGKNNLQGAQTSIHCCVQDGLPNGAYFSDCGEAWLYRKIIDDEELGLKFWNKSAQLVHLET